jgi:Flp pilus assembly protein TadD
MSVTKAASLLCAVFMVLAAVPASAGDARAWGPMSRDEAIRKLSSSQVEQRRQAVYRLADVGTMDDTPLLIAVLRDSEELVRGAAEQSLWGIWMRANDSTADPMFQVGMDLMNQNRLREAEATFTEVIALRPEFAEAWHRRGEVKVLKDDWSAAAQDFAHALELNPYHFGALEGLGHCSLHMGDPATAVGYFRRAIELNPNLWDVYEALQRAEDMAERYRT